MDIVEAMEQIKRDDYITRVLNYRMPTAKEHEWINDLYIEVQVEELANRIIEKHYAKGKA